MSAVKDYFYQEISDASVAQFALVLFLAVSFKPLSYGLSFASLNELLAQVNLVFLAAVAVAVWRFGLAQENLHLTIVGKLAAFLALFLFAVCGLFGIEQVAGLVLTLILAILLFAPLKSANFKSGLLLMLALALNSFWAPLIFQTFTAAIIAIDTTVLSWVYYVLRPDIVLSGTTFRSGEFGIVVVGICSVFASASMAVLAVAAATQYFRPWVVKLDLLVFAASLLVMLGLNTLRLALTGWDKAGFTYWHDGAGIALLGNVQLLIIAILAIGGAYLVSKRQNHDKA